MKKVLVYLFLLGLVPNLNAAKLDGVESADKIEVEGTSLLLNGMGIRKVDRFGLTFKVYVGSLYLKEKSADAEKILNSEDPKRVVMTFLRRVDGKDMIAAWQKGMFDNCISECDKYKEPLAELNKMTSDILKDGTITLTFYKDKVMVDVAGRKKSTGEIKGAAFSKNLLAVFIGKNPPTAEFKKGLLGPL